MLNQVTSSQKHAGAWLGCAAAAGGGAAPPNAPPLTQTQSPTMVQGSMLHACVSQAQTHRQI
jgi:hypothetical protein